MTLVVGLGQAGGAIVDAMMDPKRFKRFLPNLRAVALNSTRKDLERLKNLRPAQWGGLSPAKGIVPGPTPDFEQFVAGGFGKDPAQAYRALEPRLPEMTAFFRNFAADALAAGETRPSSPDEWAEIVEGRGTIPDALLVMGLGGGTGSGSAALVAQAIRNASPSTKPRIIAVCVLPQIAEGGAVQAVAANAMFGLDRLEKVVDGFILVDNQRLAFAGDAENHFPEYNAYIARALNELISAHRLDALRVSQDAANPKTPDLGDVVTALRVGDDRKPGYASLAWAAMPTKGFVGHLLPFATRHSVDASTLLEMALLKQSVAGMKPSERPAERIFSVLRVPQGMARKAGRLPRTLEMQERLATMARVQPYCCATTAKASMASLTLLFTYRRDDIVRLRELRSAAERFRTQELVSI